MLVPEDNAVTIPEVLIVATEVVADDQGVVPEGVPEPVKVVVDP